MQDRRICKLGRVIPTRHFVYKSNIMYFAIPTHKLNISIFFFKILETNYCLL